MTTTIDHLPSRIIRIKDSEYLFFSGTSYLGMGHQPEFKEALMEGMGQYGTIFSASRNNNLQLKIYEEAESFLAQWTHAEAALTVSSGLMAGQLVVQSIGNHKFIYAPSAHPAIWQPLDNRTKKEYFFESFDDFSEKINAIIEKENKPLVIACNAIDPLRCEVYDFSWVKNCPSDKDITILIDDSHGIGITGTEGGGFMSSLKNMKDIRNPNIKIIVIASLAKAVGIPGGVILSDKNTIATIRQNPLFVGASPIIPAYLFAFLKSQKTYSEARLSLQKNIDQFKNAMVSWSNTDIAFLPNYPIFYTERKELFNFLITKRVFISSFSYPNPTDPPLTRIVLSALHTEEDIENLLSAIKIAS